MKHYPLVADLNRRSVLLVGAGAVAERKAEALLAAGAQIRVVAAHMGGRFAEWAAQGSVEHLGGEFRADLLDGVFLAVAATNDSELNRAVFQAAEVAGKLCNCVDDAEHCSFIVPAVVDRSPIQVAVSSGGTSPVLVRKIRAQIETLLPLHLGRVAVLAGRWRGRVKQMLEKLGERRRFWEHLFDGAFSDCVARGDEAAAEALLQQQLAEHQVLPRGEVALVGAGPGDAGLLTLHALQAVQAADVVLYDALVSPQILAMVRRDAEKICVGKRAGAHSVRQEETNRLLVEHALQGRRVVRLKGGDPFVFGRGGEECQVLAAAGIPFRIVPGITAGLGATAYAGIPLTHRDCAQTALFITGHCRPDGDELDWQTLACGRQTLVVYMGTIKAAEIAEELIRHGRAADTPVAVVSNGTLPEQQVRIGVLSGLPELAVAAPAPALMIIGEVVNLCRELAWFDTHGFQTA